MIDLFAPLRVPQGTQAGSDMFGNTDLFAPVRQASLALPQGYTPPSVGASVGQSTFDSAVNAAAERADAVAKQRMQEEAKQRKLQAKAAADAAEAAQKALDDKLSDPEARKADAESIVRMSILDTPTYKKAGAAEREDLWDEWKKTTGASIAQSLPEKYRIDYQTALESVGNADVRTAKEAESAGLFGSIADVVQGWGASAASGISRLRGTVPVVESNLDSDAATLVSTGRIPAGRLGRIELNKIERILDWNGLPQLSRADPAGDYILSDAQKQALSKGYQAELSTRGAERKVIDTQATELQDALGPERYASGSSLRKSAAYVSSKVGDGAYGSWEKFKYAPGMATADQGASVVTGLAALGAGVATRSPAVAMAINKIGNTALTVSDAQSGAYDNVMTAKLEDLKASPTWENARVIGGSDDAAREILAAQAASYVTPAAATIGWLGGGFGAEHAISSAAGRLLAEKAVASGATATGVRSWLSGIASKVAAPMAGEGVEEGVTQALGNVAANQYGANVDVTKGVAEAATQGAIFGGLVGGTASSIGKATDLFTDRIKSDKTNPVAADPALRAASEAGLEPKDFAARLTGVQELFSKTEPDQRAAAWNAFTTSAAYNTASPAQRREFDTAAAAVGITEKSPAQTPKAATTVDQDLLSKIDQAGEDGVLVAISPKVLETLATSASAGAITPAGYAAALLRLATAGVPNVPQYDAPLAAAASDVAATAVLHANHTPVAQNAEYTKLRNTFNMLSAEQLSALDNFADKAYGLTYTGGTSANASTASSGSTAQQQADATSVSQAPVTTAIEALGGTTAEAAPTSDSGQAKNDAGAVPERTAGVAPSGASGNLGYSNGGPTAQAPTVPPAAGNSSAGSTGTTPAERPATDGSASGTTQRTGGLDPQVARQIAANFIERTTSQDAVRSTLMRSRAGKRVPVPRMVKKMQGTITELLAAGFPAQVLDRIDFLFSEPVRSDADASISRGVNRDTGSISYTALGAKSTTVNTHNIAHELGHVLDHDILYRVRGVNATSFQEYENNTVANDPAWMPVQKALEARFFADPDFAVLAYPLLLPGTAVFRRSETFAQMVGMYYTNRELLRVKEPAVVAFIEERLNEATTETPVQTTGTTASATTETAVPPDAAGTSRSAQTDEQQPASAGGLTTLGAQNGLQETNQTAPNQEVTLGEPNGVQEQSAAGEMPTTQEAGQGRDLGLQQVGQGDAQPQEATSTSEAQTQEESLTVSSDEAKAVVRAEWSNLTEAEQDALRAEHAAQKVEFDDPEYKLADWTVDTTVEELFGPTKLTPSVPLWKRAVMKLADAVRASRKAIGAIMVSIAAASGTVSMDAKANPVTLNTTPVVETISADANVVNSFVQQNADHAGKPYIIADKKAGALYIMNPDGSVRAEMPALFGKATGDSTAQSQTPAGKFRLELKDVTGDAAGMYGGNVQQFAGNDTTGIYAIHRVITTVPAQRRLERLASKSAADNRISNGCINIPAAEYNKYLNTNFNGNVYIIPEETSISSMFPTTGTAKPAIPRVAPRIEAPARRSTNVSTPIAEADMIQTIVDAIQRVPATDTNGAAVGAIGGLRRRSRRVPATVGQPPTVDKTTSPQVVDMDTTAQEVINIDQEAIKAKRMAEWDAILETVVPKGIPALNAEAQALLDALMARPMPLDMRGAIQYEDPTAYNGGVLDRAEMQLGGGLMNLAMHLARNGAARIGRYKDSFPLVAALINKANKVQHHHNAGYKKFTKPVEDRTRTMAKLMELPVEEVMEDTGMYAQLHHLTSEGYSYAVSRIDADISVQNRTLESIEAQQDWEGDRTSTTAHAKATAAKEALVTRKAKLVKSIDTKGPPESPIPGGISRPDALELMATLEAKYGKATLIRDPKDPTAPAGVVDDIVAAYQHWVEYAASEGAYSPAEVKALKDIGFKYYVPLYTEQHVVQYSQDYNAEEEVPSPIGTYAPEKYMAPSSGVQQDFSRHIRSGSMSRAADAMTNLRVFGDKMAHKIANTDAAVAIQALYEPDATTNFEDWDGKSLLPKLIRVPVSDPQTRTTYKDTPYILGRGTAKDGETQKWFRYYFQDTDINKELSLVTRQLQQGTVLRALGTMNRIMMRGMTQYVPVFNVKNPVQDWMTRFSDIQSRDLADATGKKLTRWSIATAFLGESAHIHMKAAGVRAIAHWFRTGEFSNTEYGTLLKEMLDEGALHTQWKSMELIRSGAFNGMPIKGEGATTGKLRKLRNSTVGRGVSAVNQAYVHYVVELLQMINGMVTYSTLKKLGVNKKEAALRTTDMFNATARSKMIDYLSPIYYFARARGQGGANTIKTLRSGGVGAAAARGAATLLGTKTILASFMLAAAGSLMGDDEEGDAYIDTMSFSALALGIPVPTWGSKDGSSITALPIGFGTDAIAWKWAITLRRLATGHMTIGESLATMLGATISEIAPMDVASRDVFMASPSAWAVQSLPSLVRPITEVSTNTNAFGQSIVKSRQAADTRASASGSDMTPEAYKSLAAGTYEATFGLIDPRPENAKHIIEGYLGSTPLAIIKNITSDRVEKTGGARVTETYRMGMFWTAMGAGRLYNSGAYNSEAKYSRMVERKNDILKRYNIDVTDPENKGHVGRKETMIVRQLNAANAAPKDIEFVSHMLAAEKERRRVSTETRAASRKIWANGQLATDNAPELQQLYEKDDAVREKYLGAIE